jgi:chromosome segregation ATPase
MERRRGLETRRLVVIVIFFCALAVPLFGVAGCEKQFARMEQNQIRLQAMVAANARDLATISSQLDTGQGKINESIQALDGDTQQVAANVASVRDEQRQFRDAAVAGHEGLNRRIASVEDNQRSLQGSVAQVADVTQHTATDLTTLAGEQAALQQTVHANQQELTGSLRTVASNQQRIVTGIGTLHQANQKLADDLAARHDTLYAALQSSDKQSTERYTTLTSGQGQLSADVAQVHSQLNTMTDDLAVDNSTLKEQVAAGQQTITTQIAGLSATQQQLQTSVDTLGAKADRTVADLTDTKSSLHETLRTNQEALTGQINGLSANQQQLQTSVDTLGTKADQTAADLTDMKSSLEQTLRANQETLAGRIDGLSASQQQLQTSVDTMGSKADQAAADLADTRSSLQETLRVSREVLTGQIAAGLQNQQALQNNVRDLNDKTDKLTINIADVAATTEQTAQEVAAVNNGQAALQQSLQAGNAALTARAAEFLESQQALRSGIDNLGQATQQVASNVAKMTVDQDALHQTLKAHSDKTDQQAASLASVQQEMRTDLDTLTATTGQTNLDILAMTKWQDAIQATLQSHNKTMDTRMAQLADGQQQMQNGLDTVTATTGQVSLDILAMTRRQDATQAALLSYDEALDTRMAQLADGQQQMQNGLGTVTAATRQASLDILGVAKRQDAIQADLQSHNEALDTRMAQLADGQQQMQNGLDTVTATTGQASLDILAVAKRQDAIQADLQSHNEALDTRMARLAHGQQQIQNGLDTVTATTGQASRDVLAMTKWQDAIQAALQNNKETLGARMAQLADGQQQMQSNLDTVTATTGQTALDLMGMTQRQDAIQATLQSHNETLGARIAQLADGQQQMQNGLDTVTATTGQASLDILAVTQRQDAIQAALQSHNEAVDARMTQLADSQQQMQNGLDTVTATTGQASLDALALSDSQSRLGQAVQAGRQEMADKLADMAQGQQKWSERVDAAQAKVATLDDSVAALEQRIAKLQELLQASIQGTTAIVDAASQQRLQFETRVSQDMQAMIDSLAQLRQTQVSLQDQITQVQKSTQGQADSLRSVIQQMKASPNANNRVRDEAPEVEDIVGASKAKPAPAEIQISHAAEVTPAPAVPQAAE